MLFSELSLIDPILRALTEEWYTSPTPIQEKSIPIVLSRRDLLWVAQTGTGKTASFALPILQLMSTQNPGSLASSGWRGQKFTRPIRALILTPTRELAIQIEESFANYGRHLSFRSKVIFGGISQHSQVDALSKGIDILIATPGRLLDLMNQGFIDLRGVEFFVLDEADRMLDMGFVHDVKKVIAKLPSKRQSLFFSATMPTAIVDLSRSILRDPAKVEVTPPSSTAHMIAQSVYFVDKHNKKELLKDILKDKNIERVLVFTRTKHGADKVVKDLDLARIPAKAIHGNKSQNNRQAALTGFKNKEIRVLVATDIAARGIDIDELTHVINFELPNISESYVHRIGRTGRAWASGIAIAFCDAEEKEYLRDIEKLISKSISVIHDHPYPLLLDTVSKAQAKPQGRGRFDSPKPSFKKPKVEHRKWESSAERGARWGSAQTRPEKEDKPRTWSNPPKKHTPKLDSDIPRGNPSFRDKPRPERKSDGKREDFSRPANTPMKPRPEKKWGEKKEGSWKRPDGEKRWGRW
jgi:ATP-dependent RNA helicase RhlE